MARYRKRPFTVVARIAHERETVETLEGPVVAERGDWIVTGVRGEKWPVRPDVFAERYVQVGEGIFRTLPVEVEAEVTPSSVAMREPGPGGRVLYASPGDWIVTNQAGSRYPVKPAIFAQTYEPV